MVAYLKASSVRQRYDKMAESQFWRMRHDPSLKFPKPVVIGRSMFWRLDELEQWEESRRIDCPEMLASVFE